MKKIIISVSIVLVVVFAGFGIYTLTASNKTKFFRIMSNYFEMKTGIKEKKKDINFKISTDTSVKRSDLSASFIGSLYVDGKNEKIYANLDNKLNGKDFYSLESLLQQNVIYFKLKNDPNYLFFKKIVETKDEIDNETLEKLVKVIKKAVNSTLNEKDFVKGNEKIKLGTSNVKTTTYTISVDSTKLYNLIEKIMLSDDSSIKKIYQMYSITDEQIREILDNSKETLITNSKNEEIFSYKIYVKGKDTIVKQVLNIYEEGKEVVRFSFTEFENKNQQMSYNFAVNSNGINVAVIDIDGSINGKSTISVNISSMILINGTLISDGNKTNLDLKLNVMGKEIATLSIDSIEVKKDKEYELNIKVEDITGQSFSLLSKNILTCDVDFPVFDITGAKNIDDLSDEDSKKFFEILSQFESDIDI